MSKQHYSTKVLSIFVLLFIMASTTGCFNNCGLFGATSTSKVELIIKQPIEQTNIQSGRQAKIQLGDYLAGNRKCTGNPDCDCKDGVIPATKFSYSITDSAVVYVNLSGGTEHTISEFRDRNIVRGDNVTLNIRAKSAGETTITVRTYFTAESTTEFVTVEYAVSFPVLVTE